MFIELLKDFLGQKAGQRIQVSAEDGKALIAQGVAREVQENVLSEAIQKALTDSIAQVTGGIQKEVEATLKTFADAQALSRKNAQKKLFGEGGSGDPKKTFGHFLLCVRRGDQKALEEMGSQYVEWEGAEKRTALDTQGGATGGYTVPVEFKPMLMALSSENSIVESRATRIPMGTRVCEIPALDVTTAPSSGDTAFFGGLNARWTEESATLTEDEPTFKNVKLEAFELSGYTLASNALLADNAVGLEAVLLNLFGRALGWHKDYAFLRGNGVGKPLGVLSANALVQVARTGASAFALADAAGMIAKLLPGYDPMHTVWAIHPTVLVKLFQMSDAEGNIIYINNAREKPQMMLFGLPVEVTEKLPALNTLGDVLLMDLRHYLVGDRQDVEIAFSEHYKFISNQGTWRFVTRVGGQPWLRSSVTLSDASSTLSCFVGLTAG